MKEVLELKGVPEHMIGYTIVSKIYDIRDIFYFAEKNSYEYKEMSLNLKVFNTIREINFIFSKNIDILEDIKERKKIGILMNFEVYLDPTITEDVIILHHPEKERIELKLIF
jgi:hypothetical protein